MKSIPIIITIVIAMFSSAQAYSIRLYTIQVAMSKLEVPFQNEYYMSTIHLYTVNTFPNQE